MGLGPAERKRMGSVLPAVLLVVSLLVFGCRVTNTQPLGMPYA